MKFIINSLLFSKQLNALSSVLTTNNTVPIVNCFLFHLDESLLTIRATDLETTLVSHIPVETGSMEGLNEIAVPSKQILELIKSLEDVPLTFSVDDESLGISINSGEGKYRLAGRSAETFPVMPQATETAKVNITSSALATAISKTAFAAANDDTRPQMSGILCEMSPEGLTFVTTDAHRLVRYRRKDVVSEQTVSFVLPRKPMTMLSKILSDRKEDVEVAMEYNNTNVFFTFDNFYVICRLVEGRYPNYSAAIPKENPNKMTVDRNSLLNTLQRVSLFANQASHQIRLSINDRELTVSAEDLEFANDATEKLPCQYEGDPMEIGFNANFLKGMIDNVKTEQILIEMSHPSRAGIIFPVVEESEQQSEDILMLVMPVMLAY